jgi:hypothetical protein
VDERGTIGRQAADSGVGGHLGRRDGGRLVRDDAARGRAGHGDSVDAVDSRGDVDSGIVDFSVGGECAHEEREEEDDNLLERAHLEFDVVVVIVVATEYCCYATVANAQRTTVESSSNRGVRLG